MSSGVHDRRREESGTESGPIEDRLVRVLDTPLLAKVVPYLPADALLQLVRHRGVEECGALLAAATSAQLGSVLDLDLWRSAAPGLDEQFDAARFAEWVEGLVQAGDAQAAAIVARLDAGLVVAGLSSYVRVMDVASLVSPAATDDEAPQPETTKRAGVTAEIGGYLVQARSEEGWDAIVALLLALDADHHAYFHDVMRGCRRLSDSAPEVDGLDRLLAEPDQWRLDVEHSRASRRSQQGFLSPADARAFLQLARRPTRDPLTRPAVNPIAAAYFRSAEHAAVAEGDGAEPEPPAAAPEAAVREAVHAVAALLADAARPPQRPRALLGAADHDPLRTRVHALMEAARATDEAAFVARSGEVAFLANALMAGCSIHARPFTRQEASDAALACCNLGIDLWASGRDVADDFLSTHDLVTAFERGWAALHQASLHVARSLVAVLRQVRTLDTKTHQGLVILRRELERCCAARTPWGVRDALDVLAILDTVAWTGLLGALDECPVVPDALAAIVERRKGAVSATACAFVSSVDQLATMRAFAERLGDAFSTP